MWEGLYAPTWQRSFHPVGRKAPPTFWESRFCGFGNLLLLGSLLVSALQIQAADLPSEFGGASPLAWSCRLADSEMTRRGDTFFPRRVQSAGAMGLHDLAFRSLALQLAEKTGQAGYADFGAKTVTSFIGDDGVIATYQQEEFNLDMIPPGKVLLRRWEQGHREARFRTALETLRAQLAKHPRTGEGGYWHKLRYPHQMWLDGLFMASPFLAQYGKVFAEPAAFDDVARQILLMDLHGYDAQTGLYYHAWDEKRAQDWADKVTGHSPNFWSRAIGWYGMAIVDSLDYLPPTHPEVENINAVLRRVADGIARWQDPATGLWWQVTDQGSSPGNYLEATASSMFVYTLAKGINRGYLPREKYLPVVLKGYAGIIRDLIRTDANGQVSLTRCCEVSGLGYTTAAGRPRDGTFEYYVSEPIVDNDLKGVGPFILAGLELQQLLEQKPVAQAVRGWGDYERVLAAIKAPEFRRGISPIIDFGARAGTDATAAIKAAIAACHAPAAGAWSCRRARGPPGPFTCSATSTCTSAPGQRFGFRPTPPTTRSSSRAGREWNA